MVFKANRSASALMASALCCVLIVGGCEKKKPEAGKGGDTTKKPATDKMNDAVKDAKEKTADVVKEVKDKSAEVADKGKTAITDAAAAAKEKIVTAAESGYKEATAQLDALRKSTGEVSDPIKKPIFQKALEAVEGEFKNLAGQLTKVKDASPADAPAAGTDFSSMLGKLMDTIKAAAAKLTVK